MTDRFSLELIPAQADLLRRVFAARKRAIESWKTVGPGDEHSRSVDELNVLLAELETAFKAEGRQHA